MDTLQMSRTKTKLPCLPRCDSQLHGNSAGVWTTSQRQPSCVRKTNKQTSKCHVDSCWCRIIRLTYQKGMKTSRERWNYNKRTPRVYTRTYRIPLPPPPWPTVTVLLKSQQIQAIYQNVLIK